MRLRGGRRGAERRARSGSGLGFRCGEGRARGGEGGPDSPGNKDNDGNRAQSERGYREERAAQGAGRGSSGGKNAHRV
jgi:hypothetical protein